MTGFTEPAVPGFSYAHDASLVTAENSPFQRIEIYDTAAFGRALVLDGLLQTTEADEFCYHEMLVHVPLLMLEDPRRVLIIGGGDGGALRHVLMHPTVERAVLCEIDERVTALCRTYLPAVGGNAFDDARAEVRFTDGIAFMREAADAFDVIVVDSSDPVGPGEGLFTTPFYRDAAARVTPGGIVAIQSGSPFFQQDELHRAHAHLRGAFPDVRVYLGAVPTYPGTVWSYCLGAERIVVDGPTAAARARARSLDTRYWSPAVHVAAFGLPRIVEDVTAAEGPPHTWGRSPEESHRAVPDG